MVYDDAVERPADNERAQQATQLIVTCSGSVHQAPRAL